MNDDDIIGVLSNDELNRVEGLYQNGLNGFAKDNGFEVRANGDIYILINGSSVKLQDLLSSMIENINNIGSSIVSPLESGSVTESQSGVSVAESPISPGEIGEGDGSESSPLENDN